MTIAVQVLKDHCNVTGVADDHVLARLLAAAESHVEKEIGYKLADAEEGYGADLENAILMIAAHWYENREATLVGVSAMPLPPGVPEILANYRNYTFAAVDDE